MLQTNIANNENMLAQHGENRFLHNCVIKSQVSVATQQKDSMSNVVEVKRVYNFSKINCVSFEREL